MYSLLWIIQILLQRKYHYSYFAEKTDKAWRLNNVPRPTWPGGARAEFSPVCLLQLCHPQWEHRIDQVSKVGTLSMMAPVTLVESVRRISSTVNFQLNVTSHAIDTVKTYWLRHPSEPEICSPGVLWDIELAWMFLFSLGVAYLSQDRVPYITYCQFHFPSVV